MFGLALGLGLGVPAKAAELPELVLQTGHTDGVRAVAFSPDGRLLVSAGADHVLLLWDVATGKTLRRLDGHRSSVTSAAFNADGSQVVSCDLDRVVRVWEVSTGRCAATLERPEHRGLLGAHAVAFRPGRKEVACAQDDGTVDVWDLGTSRRTATHAGHDGSAECLAFQPDGSWLATGGGDNRILIREVRSGQILRRLEGHELLRDRWTLEPGAARQSHGGVYALAFSPDGRRLASGGWDHTVRLWDPVSGRLLQTFRGHDATVVCVTFSPDGQRLVSCASDGVRMWSLDGVRNPVPKAGFGTEAHAAAFSPDGAMLATGGADHAVRLWDAASGAPITALLGHLRPIGRLGFSPDGHTLCAVAGGTALRQWDLATAQQLPSLTGHEGTITSFVFSPDGSRIVTAAFDGVVKVWAAREGRELRSIQAHGLPAQSITVAPDGRAIATGSWDRTVRWWDPDLLRERRRLEDFRFGVESVAYSPDGRFLASSEVAGPMRVWEADTGALHLTLKGERSADLLAFSPDGRWLAGPVGETVQIWDAATGEVARTLEGHQLSVKTLAFGGKGALLASAGYDQEIRLWDAGSGTLVRVLRGHDHWIHSLAFTPDGARLASASEDGRILVWDVATGAILATVLAMEAEAYMIALPDGHYVATRAASAGVGFRLGSRAFPFEQFDLRLNRPDLVLASLGLARPETLMAAREAHAHRLRRLGVDPSTFEPGYPVPDLAVIGPRPPRKTSANSLLLRVRARDGAVPLERLQVRVNGVPVFGPHGMARPRQGMRVWTASLRIPLGRGRNRIQVSVWNRQGVESVAHLLEIHREAATWKPDLYLVTLGVSDYRDARYRLTYAAKDADDVVRAFEGNQSAYARVHPLRMLNGEVTREALGPARAWLSKARVDDVAVIFLAGHGLLDSRRAYYFAPADMDFARPADRGIPYEALEALLDACPARQKLLLMDTCHAGEVDPDSAMAPSTPAGPGPVTRSFRGVALGATVPGRPKAPSLLMDLFADLRQGNGAVVIAAAGGLEFSMESDKWHNGVFTYALLEGLRDRRADGNHDGEVSVAELRSYVLARVLALTQGRQRPTVRQEPLDVDFPIF